jgi:hypothetical protein
LSLAGKCFVLSFDAADRASKRFENSIAGRGGCIAGCPVQLATVRVQVSAVPARERDRVAGRKTSGEHGVEQHHQNEARHQAACRECFVTTAM